MRRESPETCTAREMEIFGELRDGKFRAASRVFLWLMGVQWVVGIVGAVWISPHTWIGARGQVHEHVWMAVGLGGVIASLPMALAKRAPTRTATRHVMAVAQMCFSALFIHITGGRIETHFHIFGSLAFLAFYRDWRVLVTATVVVAADHMLRGIYLPLSVFGTVTESPWRWIEHAAWVVFENAFLVGQCRRGLGEWRAIASRQAGLEESRARTQREVLARTAELREANATLEASRRALHEANQGLVASAREREALHGKLMSASREVGRAEVATGVLHNVGNALNSVNVAATTLMDQVKRSEVAGLLRAGAVIREHRADLGRFVTEDPRGRHLPEYVVEVGEHLASQQRAMLAEFEVLQRGIEHIRHVITMQQAHASRKSMAEEVEPLELFEAALQMQGAMADGTGAEIRRRYERLGPVPLDRHRIIQILNNLVSNALQATAGVDAGPRSVEVAVRAGLHEGRPAAVFTVSDSGVGIPAENLERVFSMGFTTRKNGHGFGLHSAAIAAQEMGGSLRVRSDGPGRGATFTLMVPAGAGPADRAHGAIERAQGGAS